MSILYIRDENGEFAQVPVIQGKKGDKGDKPQRGVDYWTEADKEELVSDILAALPTWDGGAY